MGSDPVDEEADDLAVRRSLVRFLVKRDMERHAEIYEALEQE